MEKKDDREALIKRLQFKGKLILAILIASILFLIFSCTEEVIKVKETVRIDTVFVQKTSLASTTVIQTDTIYLDSIVYVIRDSIIMVHDTVFQTKTDTVYLTQFYVSYVFQGYVDQFYKDAKAYGWGDLPKNNLFVTKWEIIDIQTYGYPAWYQGQGASIAYLEGPQWFVKVNEILRAEKHYIAIYRELGHALLGKPYAPVEADEIMSPLFPVDMFTDRDYDKAKAKPYLDKLFCKVIL